jgi:hypothetical protein
MEKTMQDKLEQYLRAANYVVATLGFPALTDQALEDIAELSGVPLRNIETFAAYGRLNGVEGLTSEDRSKLAAVERLSWLRSTRFVTAA